VIKWKLLAFHRLGTPALEVAQTFDTPTLVSMLKMVCCLSNSVVIEVGRIAPLRAILRGKGAQRTKVAIA